MRWIGRGRGFEGRSVEGGSSRTGHRRVRAAARWASVLVAALALGSQAALGAVSAEVASTPIESGKLASVSVDCLEGTVTLGGGTDVSDPIGIDLTKSAPRFGVASLLQTPNGIAGAPTGWEGGAANGSDAEGSLHVAAICSPGVEVTAVVNSTSVAGGTFAGATAQCPEDTVAISGGAAVGNLQMRITEMAPNFPETGPLANTPEGENPAPSGWTAFAQNPGGGSPILKVAVLCADIPHVVAMVAARNTMPNGGPAGGEVDCSIGKKALGGGIGSLNPLELTVTASAPRFPGEAADLWKKPDGTNPAPSGWNALGRNDSDDFLVVSRAAICVPEPAASWASLASLAAVLGVARFRTRRIGS